LDKRASNKANSSSTV